ncbi:outer membrane protein, nutrient binding [Filimonas lacunae]|nr:outer membrane protein, nutrient binding [Filimonas lacunae]
MVITGLLLTGCKKSYLNTTPNDSATIDEAFANTTTAWGAINGIHRSLYIQYAQQDQGGQGSVAINLDYMGEDLVKTGTGSGWFTNSYRWKAHRAVTGTTDLYPYRFYYKIIHNANMIIENVDRATGPAADKRAIKGEAYVYRAWAHFVLVQLYGKRYNKDAAPNTQPGVPLRLSSSTDPLARATVEQVYTQVNTDLDSAITNLTGYNRTYKSHFNVQVAQGIKARVALTMQNWDSAAVYAATARQGYSLMSRADYLTGFNNISNIEWMWGSQQTADQTTYFYSFFAYMSANYASSDIRTNPKAISSMLYRNISKTDVRKQLWDSTGANTSFPIPANGVRKQYMNRKFLTATSSSIGDVPNMRAAEMYLIEAEAKARAGDNGGAQDALYQLAFQRDSMYTKSTRTGQALITEIMRQRRTELWGEGFRFLDLKRLNLPLDRTGANHDATLAEVFTVPVESILWQWLIPQDEINYSSGLVTQNDL